MNQRTLSLSAGLFLVFLRERANQNAGHLLLGAIFITPRPTTVEM